MNTRRISALDSDGYMAHTTLLMGNGIQNEEEPEEMEQPSERASKRTASFQNRHTKPTTTTVTKGKGF